MGPNQCSFFFNSVIPTDWVAGYSACHIFKLVIVSLYSSVSVIDGCRCMLQVCCSFGAGRSSRWTYAALAEMPTDSCLFEICAVADCKVTLVLVVQSRAKTAVPYGSLTKTHGRFCTTGRETRTHNPDAFLSGVTIRMPSKPPDPLHQQ